MVINVDPKWNRFPPVPEAGSYYDRVYTDPTLPSYYEYRKNWRDSHYSFLHRILADHLDEIGKNLGRPPSILEVGCGSGRVGEMVKELRLGEYRGFDISQAAVELANTRVPGAFFVGSAADPQSYTGTYDVIVCTEVLEHVKDDLSVVCCWKPGTVVLYSVPNFRGGKHVGHVRFFEYMHDVLERYHKLIDPLICLRLQKSDGKNCWYFVRGIRCGK